MKAMGGEHLKLKIEKEGLNVEIELTTEEIKPFFDGLDSTLKNVREMVVEIQKILEG